MKPLPSLPDAVPSRGGMFERRCWLLLLRVMGWEFEGEVPNLSRFVIIGAPHTSNWDFVVALGIIGYLGLRIQLFGKHTIFRWPLGPLLRRMGGIPVDRRKAHGLVEQAIETFASADKLVVAMAPEGTRERTRRWKSGFYHIAAGAAVPIVPAYIDFSRRRVGMGEPLVPTGDMERDVHALYTFYVSFANAAKHPQNFGYALPHAGEPPPIGS